MTKPDASGRIEITAPPERVYDLVSDLRTMVELAEETVAFEWLDGANSAAVGARFRGTNRRGTRRWSTVCTVTDAEPGRRFAFDVSALGAPVSRWQYEIVPTDGGCEVTESSWERYPKWLWLVGSLASGTWRRTEVNQGNIEATLRRLKERAETTV